MEREDDAGRQEAKVVESPAWLAHLMASYDAVVLPVVADCVEEPAWDPGSEKGPEAHAALEAIMRYYNG